MTKPADSWRHRALATLLTGTMCLTSGCSLFNPHVEPSVPLQTYGPQAPTPAELAKMTEEEKAAALKPEFAGGVGQAIDRVNAWREEYYDAVGEQSMMKNGIALTVIPAAAVAAYFGITGGNRDVIAGLATGAAGLLGLGVFFESENRQQIYLSGYRSMGCLLFASAPLLMRQDRYDALRTDIEALDIDLGRLDNAIFLARASAENLRKKEVNNPLLLEADTEIAAAKQLTVKAEEAQAGGVGLLSRVDQAGLIIETAAGNIAAEVSSQIVDDEPRLSALTEITGGLAGVSERVARIPPPKEKKPAAVTTEGVAQSALSDEEKDLIAKLKDLRDIRDAVTIKARRLQLTVNQYADITLSLQNIKGCGFEAIDLGLKILPDQDSFELQTGQSQSILISGGKRPYSAGLSGQVPEGVTLTRSGFDQQPVVAVVTAGTKTGEFDLAIQDASGNGGMLVHFTVVAALTGPAEVSGGGGGVTLPTLAPAPLPLPPVRLTDAEARRSAKQHRVAQYAVGLRGDAVDGKIGNTTRSKVKEFQTAKQLAPTGEIDDALYEELIKVVDADWANARPLLDCELADTHNVFECTRLNKGMLEQVQEKLGVPKTGQLDSATRTAIEESSHEPGDRPSDRQALSFGLTKAILGL